MGRSIWKKDASENFLSVPFSTGGETAAPGDAISHIASAYSTAGFELWPCFESTNCPSETHLEFGEVEGWLMYMGHGGQPEVDFRSWLLFPPPSSASRDSEDSLLNMCV